MEANSTLPTQVSITTSTKKNVPVYNVQLTITPKSGGKSETIELSRPFNEWFDSVGHFIALPFQTVFASSVPLIAKVDPKRAQTAAAAASDSAFTNVDAAMLDALAASSATGTEAPVSEKKSKRRKV
jgi:signal peptidase complex subunit 2